MGNREVAYASRSQFKDPLADMQAPVQEPGHPMGNCSHCKGGKKSQQPCSPKIQHPDSSTELLST